MIKSENSHNKEVNNCSIAFFCLTRSSNRIINIISSLEISKNIVAECIISKKGILFKITEDKNIILKAFLYSKSFESYDINTDILSFSLNISLLINCMSILKGIFQLSIKYEVGDGFLVINSKNDHSSTNCFLRHINTKEDINFIYNNQEISCKIVLESSILKEIMLQINIPGAFYVELLFSNRKELVMNIKGNGVKLEVIMSNERFIHDYFFLSEGGVVINHYLLSKFLQCYKSSTLASQASIKINNEGMMLIQFLIPFREVYDNECRNNCVEMILCPVQSG